MNKKNSNLIIVISSPSGAGKTSVCKKLLDQDHYLGLSVSDTTRPARDNETDGVDYNFIEEKDFKVKIKNNAYIEYAKVFGNYYGSLCQNIIDHSECNKDILFDIDWQGAVQLKNSSFLNIITIFIVPPSKDIVYERLKLRAKTSGDDLNAINKRMKQYETEMSHRNDYDYIVINDSLDTCVKEIKKIINYHRNNLMN